MAFPLIRLEQNTIRYPVSISFLPKNQTTSSPWIVGVSYSNKQVCVKLKRARVRDKSSVVFETTVIIERYLLNVRRKNNSFCFYDLRIRISRVSLHERSCRFKIIMPDACDVNRATQIIEYRFLYVCVNCLKLIC